ncbi:MAG: cytochrome c [Acidimicrobiales bacterium]
MTSLCRLFFSAVLAFAVVGCGAQYDPAANLTPDEAEGLRVVEAKGCQSCHGDQGRGGAGPAWTGLAGSEVELADGSVVVADEAYLLRSILDPSADLVAGYNLRMPPNDLTQDEAEAVVAYIGGR